MSNNTILSQLKAAKVASQRLSSVNSSQKNDALNFMADELVSSSEYILNQNSIDVSAAEEAGESKAIIDRILLSNDRINQMAEGLIGVSKLDDPINKDLSNWQTERGLSIKKVSVPLGVVAVIYENRPNVTSDAAGLLIKSGNIAVLRGSKAALNSNLAVVKALHKGLEKSVLPNESITFINSISREDSLFLMQSKKYIDCIIPRGGPSLISAIEENATVPFILDGAGNCHIFVDEFCDVDKAVQVVVNAKAQRPSVCNAAETLLVHKNIAEEFISKIAEQFAVNNITMHASNEFAKHLTNFSFIPAIESDFENEFLSTDIACEIVDNVKNAVDFIEKYSSGHTEAILSNTKDNIEYFVNNISSSVVNVNASTRFSDGEMFGFGAEIGISTQKLHARGPMGLAELTTYKYIVEGDYNIR